MAVALMSWTRRSRGVDLTGAERKSAAPQPIVVWICTRPLSSRRVGAFIHDILPSCTCPAPFISSRLPLTFFQVLRADAKGASAMADDEQERPLWKLSRDEQRVLFITFIGGLASVIAAAVIIGLALAIARYERGVSSLPELAAYTVATGVFAVLGIYLLLSPRPPTLLPPGRAKRLVKTLIILYIFTLTVAAFCVFILTWIGIAAGIH